MALTAEIIAFLVPFYFQYLGGTIRSSLKYCPIWPYLQDNVAFHKAYMASTLQIWIVWNRYIFDKFSTDLKCQEPDRNLIRQSVTAS